MDFDTPCIIKTYIEGTRLDLGLICTSKPLKNSFVSGCQTGVAMDMRYVLQDYVLPFMERNTLDIIQGPSTGHSRVVGHGSKWKSIDMLHV
jgi:hypothetical protein